MQSADGGGINSPESRELEIILQSLPSPIRDQHFHALIEISRTKEGRSELSGLNLVPRLLTLVRSLLSRPFGPDVQLVLSDALRLVRNLCAGDGLSHDAFFASDGMGIVAIAIDTGGSSDVVAVAFQVYANVATSRVCCLADLWGVLFPSRFWRGLCCFNDPRIVDPLCRVLHLCVSEDVRRLSQLCGEEGLSIMVELIRKSQDLDGVEAQWVRLLLQRICLKPSCFSQLYSGLSTGIPSDDNQTNTHEGVYSIEQASLLHAISDSLNQRGTMLLISKDVALFIFNIFQSAAYGIRDSFRRQSTFPTDAPVIDILRYSLRIIRDICAMVDPKESSSMQESSLSAIDDHREEVLPVVDLLVSAGIVSFLLGVLRDLEDPPIVKNSRTQVTHPNIELARNAEERPKSENSLKSCEREEPVCMGLHMPCSYKGFRSDIVAVIANLLYGRKHVQDEIRRQGGTLLLLQQNGIDEDNPFLREWGFWAARNLFEGNEENIREVAALQLQGVANSTEISALGLQVTFDPESGRVKLVNVTQ